MGIDPYGLKDTQSQFADDFLVGGLVAIFYFPIYWVSNHPKWLSYFSKGWPNHQPVFLAQFLAQFLQVSPRRSSSFLWKARSAAGSSEVAGVDFSKNWRLLCFFFVPVLWKNRYVIWWLASICQYGHWILHWIWPSSYPNDHNYHTILS